MMLDEMENLKELFLELGSFDSWLQDPRVSGNLQSRAKAEGREEGREEGQAKTMRQNLLTLLTRRFGALPEDLVSRINASDVAWCERLFEQAITATSLAEATTHL